jgi:hypothetical protein
MDPLFGLPETPKTLHTKSPWGFMDTPQICPPQVNTKGSPDPLRFSPYMSPYGHFKKVSRTLSIYASTW